MIDESRNQRYLEKLERLKEYKLLFDKWFDQNLLEKFQKQDNFERLFAIYHSIQLMIEVITEIVSI